VPYHMRRPMPGELSGQYVQRMVRAGVPEVIAQQVFAGVNPPAGVVLYNNPQGNLNDPVLTAQSGTSTTPGASGTSAVNPQIAVAQIDAASQAAEIEYNRWKEELRYTRMTPAEQEQIALEKARLAADTKIREEQNRLASVQTAQQGALGLLNLAGQLRGPRNAFQYLRVMGQTPQGLTDLVRSLGGAYRVPGMAGATGTPEAANLSNFMQDVAGAGMGLSNGQTAGQAADAQANQDLSGLVDPNQIDVANYSRLNSFGKQMALGAYEAKGFDAETVEEAIKRAAPEFKTPAMGRIKF